MKRSPPPNESKHVWLLGNFYHGHGLCLNTALYKYRRHIDSSDSIASSYTSYISDSNESTVSNQRSDSTDRSDSNKCYDRCASSDHGVSIDTRELKVKITKW